MRSVNTISEGDVLLAVMRFLLARKAIPYRVSVPTGHGINAKAIKQSARNIFANVDFKPDFKSTGPDILALSEEEWWLVECKGVGTGKAQTQRNNFDRALASVVSYYEEHPMDVPEWGKNASVCLGLAVPRSAQYLSELRRRVRAPLRKRLNLWVLLYDSAANRIEPIPPTQEV